MEDRCTLHNITQDVGDTITLSRGISCDSSPVPTWLRNSNFPLRINQQPRVELWLDIRELSSSKACPHCCSTRRPQPTDALWFHKLNLVIYKYSRFACHARAEKVEQSAGVVPLGSLSTLSFTPDEKFYRGRFHHTAHITPRRGNLCLVI